MDDISGAKVLKHVRQGNLADTVYCSAGTLLGFVLGYIVGIVNDIKLNEGDTVIKKFLIRIMKVIFTVYVEVFRDNTYDRTGNDRIFRNSSDGI
mgnify:CR=1 FL=1